MALRKTASANEPQPCHLLAMPPELRLNIYDRLAEEIRDWDCVWFIVWADRVHTRVGGNEILRHFVNILKVCKEIYNEARGAIYSQIPIKVTFKSFYQRSGPQAGYKPAAPGACELLQRAARVSFSAHALHLFDELASTAALAKLDALLNLMKKNRNLREWTCSIWRPSTCDRGQMYKAIKNKLEALTDSLQQRVIKAEYLGEGKCRSGLLTQVRSNS